MASSMPIFQHDFGQYRDTSPKASLHSTTTIPSTHADTVAEKASNKSTMTESYKFVISNVPELNHIPKKADKNLMTYNAPSRLELIDQLKNREKLNQDSNLNLESPLHQHEQNTLVFKTPPHMSEYNDYLLSDHENEGSQSALHSGDFTEEAGRNTLSRKEILPSIGSCYKLSPIWLASTERGYPNPLSRKDVFPCEEPDVEATTIWPTSSLVSRKSLPSSLRDTQNYNLVQPLRSKYHAPSFSSPYSSSFRLKAPTSPLAHSLIDEDLEPLPVLNSLEKSPKLPIYPRRHTLQASHSVNAVLHCYEKDLSLSHKNEEVRASASCSPFYTMSAFTSQSLTSSSCNRPVCISDHSQPYHASMVGSYEESILHGRMSTTPSKPLDFLAQIGVLGTGECKPSLRCPAHVTIPFPAVFFSYETTSNGRISESEHGPSPYVGLIDLENNLHHGDGVRYKKRKRSNHQSRGNNDKDLCTANVLNTCQSTESKICRSNQKSRRLPLTATLPRGSYRIPKTGQIQIIIKNPNKTAVKLFLVPYDLSGMEPGTKTFIRQRSYSAGPVIDGPLTSSIQTVMLKSSDRKILRYLVHLQICSPSPNRFYLYKSIRVVFANRVPDGEEKLWNEISLPEPRFNKFKPNQDSRSSFDASQSSNCEEITFPRPRRSSGIILGHPTRSPQHRYFR